MSEISNRILQLITEKELSYSDLSKRTSISKSALQRYATGETPKIPLDRLELIAKALGVSAAYLMGWEETKKAPVPSAVTTDDEELIDLLEELRSRPEMRMLFSLSKNATKEDVEDAVRIIEALRKGRQS